MCCFSLSYVASVICIDNDIARAHKPVVIRCFQFFMGMFRKYIWVTLYTIDISIYKYICLLCARSLRTYYSKAIKEIKRNNKIKKLKHSKRKELLRFNREWHFIIFDLFESSSLKTNGYSLCFSFFCLLNCSIKQVKTDEFKIQTLIYVKQQRLITSLFFSFVFEIDFILFLHRLNDKKFRIFSLLLIIGAVSCSTNKTKC